MNKFKIILYSLSALICFILIIYGLDVFPMPGTDSIVFITPAILYAKGAGLANPLYYVTQLTDPTHTGRFNYYVPLYSWLLGMLSKIKPGVKTIFIWCSLFSVAGILLYARTIASYLPEKTSAALKAIILLSLAYVATYLLPTVGRPETITTLLSLLIYVIYNNRKNYNAAVYNAAVCVLFALVLSAQILCFYFGFLFLLTYELLNSTDVFKTIWINAARLAAIIVLFCLVLALSPNGLINTLIGISRHIALVLDRGSGGIELYIYFWLLAPLNFGFAFVFLLCSVYYIKELNTRLRNLKSVQVILVVILQLFILLGLVKYVLYAAPTIYNATQFILPMSAFLVLQIRNNFKKSFSALTLITFAAGTIVFIRGFILFVDNKMEGKDFDSAKAIVDKLYKDYHNISITNSLWVLPENPYDVKLFNRENLKKDNIFIVQQANYDLKIFRNYDHTVIYNWRTTKKEKKFLGIPISVRPHGYSFVVYKIN